MTIERVTAHDAVMVNPETGAELKITNLTITPLSELSAFKINKILIDYFRAKVKIKGYRKPKSNNRRIK